MYVLMITPNNFPNGDAGAVRDLYFSKVYQELGYDIIYIGMNPEQQRGIYNNIVYYSMYEKRNSLKKKIQYGCEYGNKLKNLVSYIENENGSPCFIHIYDIPELGIKYIKEYAANLGIPIVHDSVEWYSPCEFRFGVFSYPYILKNRLNRKLIKKPISVIAISRFLEIYFTNKGITTLRIPVIMDCEDYLPLDRIKEDKIRLVYAGSPAKKDYLFEVIKAFELLDDSIKKNFEFNLFGVEESYIVSCCDGKMPIGINAYGRVPRERVIKELAQSDFSILLRPADERYARAGFPTKSVEALMNGCGLICNLTSDLEMYLDDKNAIIVKDCTIEAMYEALVRVSNLGNDEFVQYRKNARKTAEKYFDYRLYIDSIRNFLKLIGV